jgi:hypothetical protein
MQKKRGGLAEACNSAELAAMFDLRVFPQLLQAQLLKKEDGHTEQAIYDDYVRQRKEFAAQIGRHWTLVFYPFWLSMDNCKKHPWLRRLMLQPRLSDAEAQQMAEEFKCELDRQVDERAKQQWMAEHGKNVLETVAAMHDLRTPADEQAAYQEAAIGALQAHMQCNRDARRAALAAERDSDGLTLSQRMYEAAAWRKPWLRLMWPEQFMPLTPCTPDIHMVVEHMVRTIKAFVRRAFWVDMKGRCPWQAKTYQHFMNEGVKQRGNGKKGRDHIAGSLGKLPKTLQILAAKKGEVLTITHEFGKHSRGPSTRTRRLQHRVCGTAGGYIADTRWT